MALKQTNKSCVISVCLQLTVEAVIGGSVVLPCSSAEHDLKIQDINVHWRHNGSKIVFDIIPHSNSPVTQDPEYKNRTETFPQEYLRGNFSIKLNHLQHTDAGQYICYITHSSKYQTKTARMNVCFPYQKVVYFKFILVSILK
uniref:Ig-like domain-containing protein n=1 Tax=Sinocyclocheilus grahami TaxID=75366 RepID=A0A672TEJ1_SINGR